MLRACPVEEMREGDAFICNDPYLANGTHLPDITIVTPVFFEGRVEFFTANIGHHSDVGGAVPGSIAGGSRSIFEEGMRIPVIRIVRAGELDEDLLNLIASQHARSGGARARPEGADRDQRARRARRARAGRGRWDSRPCARRSKT